MLIEGTSKMSHKFVKKALLNSVAVIKRGSELYINGLYKKIM
jgi:hypothetical protein